ncbi:MAG: signal peptidase I [Pyrinomonadaceae bacterium]
MFFKRKVQRALPFGGVSIADDPGIEIERPHASARAHLWSEIRLLVRDLIFALMFALLIGVFAVQPVKVEGTSMLPRLHDGERILVNKLVYYGLPHLARGDVVVFWYPNNPSQSYVKRVIGLPGEIVEVRGGRIFINGQELLEPYLDTQLDLSHRTQRPVLVKEHYYFVMGDNRDNSSDSRIWGLVPEKYIYGKALFRFWPLADWGVLSHDPDYNIAPPRSNYNAETPEHSGTDDEP